MILLRYQNYKASQVDWLGQIPEHWEVRRLGFFFDERREKVSDSDYQALSVTMNGIVPQLETAAKTDDGDNRKLVLKGDFVINSRSDRKGSSGISPLDGSVSLISTVISPRNSICGAFVHHLLRSGLFQEEYYRFGKGIVADLWSTNYSAMKNISLAIPPLPEQHAIAQFLDRETAKIDALIAEQERLIALLGEKRAALISQAVTKGLDPTVPMKDSGVPWLGEVPAHWEVSGFTKYLEPIVDYRGKTPEKVDDGVLLITARNIRYGFIDYQASQEYVRPEDYEEIMRRGAPVVGDVLFTMEAPLGMVANVDRVDIALAQRVVKFRGNIGVVDNYFLKYWILGSLFQAELETLATGSTALGIKSSKLGQLTMCLPPLQEQTEIFAWLENQLTSMDEILDASCQVVELLQERRTALISAAVTGKIDVREAVGASA